MEGALLGLCLQRFHLLCLAVRLVPDGVCPEYADCVQDDK